MLIVSSLLFGANLLKNHRLTNRLVSLRKTSGSMKYAALIYYNKSVTPWGGTSLGSFRSEGVGG